MNVSRRGFHASALALAVLPVRAQAPAPRSYVVASFAGDKIELVGAGMQTGTRLDPNTRHAVPDSGGAMDKVLLGAVARGLAAADAAASVALTLVAPSRLHDSPESLLQPDGVALPGAVVDVIEQRQATHVVLVTKLTDDARFELRDRTVGRGKLRGLGFYLDEWQRLENVESRESGRGFIAPYVYVRLSLVDVSTAKVLRERKVAVSEVVPIYASKTAATPWDALGQEEKARRLESLIRTHVTPAAQALAAPR